MAAKPSCNADFDTTRVMEHEIECIDLRVDSGDDNHQTDPEDNSNDTSTITSDVVTNIDKDESLNTVDLKNDAPDGLSNVQVVGTSHIPQMELKENIQNQYLEMEVPTKNIVHAEIPSFVVKCETESEITVSKQVQGEIVLPQISNVTGSVNVPIEIDDEEGDDIIQLNADQSSPSGENIASDEDKTVVIRVDELIKKNLESLMRQPEESAEEMKIAEEVKNDEPTNSETKKDDLCSLDFVDDDGIEFLDDGIEYVEEDEVATAAEAAPDDPVETKLVEKEEHDEEDTNAKFDLKLLMDPVVYTTKLDCMKIFKSKSFNTVVLKEDIETVIAESKPTSKQTFAINIKEKNREPIDDTSDDLFTNQDSSDDSDTEINESQKVSVNSGMLKKPRSRSYNPIQLCKNPDFNTKLRRLTIGFFSSTRNRMLLNACVPMTIDVSKSFESKLVNGTLFLKSGPQPVKETEVYSNQTSSVVPLAMPVQSLLDITKVDLKDLMQHPTPKPKSDDEVLNERKKIINLPDIDDVRRINQQLLTAEVTPIRFQNDTPIDEPVVKKEIDTDETNENITETASNESVVVPVNVGALSVKVEKDPDLVESIPPEPLEVLPPAKQKLLNIITLANKETQEKLSKIDVADNNSKELSMRQVPVQKSAAVQKKTNPAKRNFTKNKVVCSWTSKFKTKQSNIDDFLLTADTLNKMLHLMFSETGEKKCACLEKGKKSKNSKHECGSDDEPIKVRSASIEKTEIIEQHKEEPQPPAAPKPKVTVVNYPKKGYCCWARHKLKNKRSPRHKCPAQDCNCCCREELAMVLIDKLSKKRSPIVTPVISNTTSIPAIELSDDEDIGLKKACESIDIVVQQSRETNSAVTLDNEALNQPNIMQPVTVTQKQFESCVVFSGNPPPLSPVKNLNVPKIQIVYPPLQSTQDAAISPPQRQLMVSKLTPVSAPPPDTLLSLLSRKSKPPPILPSLLPCSCQVPTIRMDPQRHITIDASKTCTCKPLAPNPREKVLYLHSNSIPKSSNESPIFLGKNKILLTTVKFPRKQNDENLPQCEAFQGPKIIPTLPVPTGVNLALLPSGVVSYTLDPGVELTEAQQANMPTIVAAVQAQLNTPLQKPTNTISNDTPIDLDQPQAPAIDALNEDNVDQIINSTIPEPNKNIEETESQNRTTENVAMELDPDNTSKDENVSETTVCPSKETNDVNKENAAQEQLTTNTTPIVEDVQNNSQIIESDDKITDSTTVKENAAEQVPLDNAAPAVAAFETVHNQQDTNVEEKESESNSRKCLLSDLMEMSGISPEDATTIEPPPTENLPELSPVTSFAELKYACEQDGKFFKLDFETGVLVPINVCIKKNPKPPTSLLKPKAVIDLTDDVEADSTAEEINSDTNSQESTANSVEPLGKPIRYTYRGATLNVPSVAKPVKIFRAVHQPKPQILMRRQKVDEEDTTNVTQIVKNINHIQKRKQILNKVEAKIDLVDSDAPMEEEYLLDSSDDDSVSNTETDPLPKSINDFDESDDSSDDEPLAKKSKRMKDTETTDKDKEIDEQKAQGVKGGNDKEQSLNVGIDPVIDAPIPSDRSLVKVVPTELLQCKEELNEELLSDEAAEPVLKFIADNSDAEDNGDNCILGV